MDIIIMRGRLTDVPEVGRASGTPPPENGWKACGIPKEDC